MSYEKNNTAAILESISVIALGLVTATSFNHSYTAFAGPKKGASIASHANGITTLGGGSSYS
jgi:hypothetical protein